MNSIATANVGAAVGYHPTAGVNSVAVTASGNTWSQSRTFNNVDRLTVLQQGTLVENRTYDNAGRVQGVQRGAINWAFGYDNQSQLTSAGTGGYARTSSYDNLGNILSLAINGATATYTPNLLNQRAGFSYDADGNLLSDGTWAFTWDGQNHLTSATSGAVSYVYTYDGFHRRTLVASYTSGTLSAKTRFVYDGFRIIREETEDGLGNLTGAKHYTWGPDVSNTLDGAAGIGGLVAVDDGSQVACPVYSGNWNIVGWVTTNGQVLYWQESDPFGLPVGLAQGTQPSAYGFSTKYQDPTGLVYYGYRYYHPGLAVWLGRDPLGEKGGVNLYRSNTNNPSNHTDSLGLYATDIHYYAVLDTLLASGMPDNEAYTLALFSQYPDIDKRLDARWSLLRNGDTTNQRLFHMLNGKNLCEGERIRDTIRRMYKENRPAWQKGMLLHILGDTYGHLKLIGQGDSYLDYGFRYYDSGLGHTGDGVKPDEPFRRPTLAMSFINDVRALYNLPATVELLVYVKGDEATRVETWRNAMTRRYGRPPAYPDDKLKTVTLPTDSALRSFINDLSAVIERAGAAR